MLVIRASIMSKLQIIYGFVSWTWSLLVCQKQKKVKQDKIEWSAFPILQNKNPKFDHCDQSIDITRVSDP